MHGTVARANGKTRSDCAGDKPLGKGYGAFDAFTEGKVSRDGCRERATRTMGILCTNALRREGAKIFAVKEQINRRALQMATFDEHAARAKVDDLSCGILDRCSRR